MKTRPQILVNLKEHLLLQGGGPDDNGLAAQLTYRGYANHLQIIISWTKGWDHVSVSARGRCPHWDEMCFVKDFFFQPDECVIQYHPPESSYVNNHKNCLHLWRPQEGEIQMPPLFMV